MFTMVCKVELLHQRDLEGLTSALSVLAWKWGIHIPPSHHLLANPMASHKGIRTCHTVVALEGGNWTSDEH